MARIRSIQPPLSVSVRTPRGEGPATREEGWDVKVRADPAWKGPGTKVQIRATWKGQQEIDAGLVIHRDVADDANAKVLVPAVFYGDNGPGGKFTHYPRLGPVNHENFTSPTWDFASERSSLPAVFYREQDQMTWLAVEPGGTGVGFDVSAGHSELRVHAPGLERPYTHDRQNEAPTEPRRHLKPGESIEVKLWYGTEQFADAHAVAQVQRGLQKAFGHQAPQPLSAQTVNAVRSAARDGLVGLHHRKDSRGDMLVETVSFDGTQVRPEMHVGWVSGTPSAFALLRHGLSQHDAQAANAARAVLDTVSTGLSPSGFFWGELTQRGWTAGWNGQANKLQARTLSEATLFLLRALALEPDHADWKKAAISNLEAVLRSMDEHGNPGSFYDAQTGEVLDRAGTGGLLWAATLVEAAKVLKEPRYQAAAQKIGQAYAANIQQGTLHGAPEDIGLGPSSEDAYNALLSTLALYESTQDRSWLQLARDSADWLLTYRWSYNVEFPEGTPLDQRGFKTVGADGASPSNNHLHNYGMIASDALYRLSRYTGDGWYAARAQDHLAAFTQAIAFEDHQFGGPEKRGMMAEQIYTANWAKGHRAGEFDPQSHAWVLGLTLLAMDDWSAMHQN